MDRHPLIDASEVATGSAVSKSYQLTSEFYSGIKRGAVWKWARRRDFQASGWSRRARGALCPVFGRSAGRVPCRDSKPGRGQVVVAQRVEHQVFNLGVAGSIPVHNTPRSAENRLLGDAENVSTTEARGERAAASVGPRPD